ncbi:18278_t:CDS:1, partial [Gigaspora margarita]
MESEEEFDKANLCFTSNVDVNIFEEILNSNRQLRTEEGGNSTDSEVETDLTDSEEYLYPLTKGQSVKG